MVGDEWLSNINAHLIQPYQSVYPELVKNGPIIYQSITQEVDKFRKTIDEGLKEFEKYVTIGEVGKPETRRKILDPKSTFFLYETYGFPYELTKEEAVGRGIEIPSKDEFDKEAEKHKLKSRTASVGMFKGGLADQSVETTKLHTAHHLLLAGIQKIVDPKIKQRGSNITAERLRVDFSIDRKLTPEEIKKVEDLVNQKISEKLPVVRIEMKKGDAEKIGAQMEFGTKYPDKVSVYFIGLNTSVKPEQATSADYFSAEFCGGPHVANTSEIGEGEKKFKIQKEESVGSGVRRIKGVLI